MTRGPSAGSGLPAVKIAVTRSGVQFSASTQHFSAVAAACLACSGRSHEHAAVRLHVAHERRVGLKCRTTLLRNIPGWKSCGALHHMALSPWLSMPVRELACSMRWWGWLLRRPARAAKLSGVTDSWACASSRTRISGALFSSLPRSLSLCSRALIASRLEARKAAARALHNHNLDGAPQISCLAATRHTVLSANWGPRILHFYCSLDRACLLARTRASSRASPARESQSPSAWLAANTSLPQRTARSRICHTVTHDSAETNDSA